MCVIPDDAVPEPNRKDAGGDVHCAGQRRKMFRHTRNNGDVDLGIAHVPQRVVEPGFIIKIDIRISVVNWSIV